MAVSCVFIGPAGLGPHSRVEGQNSRRPGKRENSGESGRGWAPLEAFFAYEFRGPSAPDRRSGVETVKIILEKLRNLTKKVGPAV